MTSISLKIDDQSEITLPYWIGGTSLTLAEIGAIACVACLKNGREVPEMAERIFTPEMQMSLDSLKEKGVFTVTLEGSSLAVNLDLDAVMPSSLRYTA